MLTATNDLQLDPGARAALRNPEMVTLAGDFHGEAGWARHVVKAAGRAGSNVVVQVGDFGVWDDSGGRHFLDEVNRWCQITGVPVLFVDGNHEDHEFLDRFPVDAATGLRVVRPWVVHAPRGHRWTWRGVSWLALGGATSLDRARRTEGFDWFAGEALTLGDAYRANADGQVDVMVTHDCPAGVPIPGLGATSYPPEAVTLARAHRELLRQVVDHVRPTHLFHGHFHVKHRAELDLGDGLSCVVRGLDMNGTGGKAYEHVDLDLLVLEVALAREAAATRP